jgi:hypothetical protein
VRKIISILVTLGLVLTFSAVAMPTATGAATCGANVTLSNDCAASTGVTYTIDFVATKTLFAGNDQLSFEFADGTTFGTFVLSDVTVNINAGGAIDVLLADIAAAAPDLSFVLPPGADIVPLDVVQVVIKKVSNPVAHGAKVMNLDYKFACCDPEVFDCANYTIKPAISSYGFKLDFDTTYPGIAEDFVPPFKACGQADNATGNETFDTLLLGGLWYTQFDIILFETVVGCNPACANATLSFNVTAMPAGSHVSLNISGEGFVLTPTASAGTLTANVTLIPGTNNTFPSLLHFDTVGEYEICFDVTCPGDPAGSCPECLPATGPESIIDGPVCYPFNVHQWKDAAKIELDEKWNLISLPLVPFDGDIDVLLASLPAEATDGDAVDELISIWYYDRCGDEWTMYEGGGLTEMIPDASYWVRMSYPITASPAYNWWVWGTARAMPPAAPLAYDMCPGWNMFGYTELTDTLFQTYLWNLDGTANEPLVYGWSNTGDWTTSGWLIRNTGDTLFSGQGYWGYFLSAGTIVPP